MANDPKTAARIRQLLAEAGAARAAGQEDVAVVREKEAAALGYLPPPKAPTPAKKAAPVGRTARPSQST